MPEAAKYSLPSASDRPSAGCCSQMSQIGSPYVRKKLPLKHVHVLLDQCRHVCRPTYTYFKYLEYSGISSSTFILKQPLKGAVQYLWRMPMRLVTSSGKTRTTYFGKTLSTTGPKISM